MHVLGPERNAGLFEHCRLKSLSELSVQHSSGSVRISCETPRVKVALA